MDELIKLLVERIQVTEEQARAAVTTVVEYLAQHLPDSAAGLLPEALGEGVDGDPSDPDRARKTAVAAVAATTAAVNAVVLSGAH
jgi:hypothetical protein